jgi:acyl CoA:acetate/3-ketoacid CoA transferase beta subunit
VREVIVVMEHVARDGSPKFKPRCELPLTGAGVVDMLITDLAVFRRPDRKSGFELSELAPGVTEAQVRERTTAQFRTAMVSA